MTIGRTSSMQTLLVGLDGACRDVLDRLRSRDAVPTIDWLRQDGYVDDLTSQLPPWTPSAWPSLYTGVNPGKHGVFGFLTFDGYDWDVVDRACVREHAVWELLDGYGFTSVVVNVPVTHPPRSIDGAVVPGYVAPENPTCVPDDALSLLSTDEYTIYPPKGNTVSRDAQVTAFEDLVRSRGRAFRELSRRFEPDFGFVEFQQTDTVFHERPGDWDAVERVYAAVDDELRAILDECQPRNVIVVSDHGMGKYTGYEFRVNEFLKQHGYVNTRNGGEGMPSWDSIARNQLREGERADGHDRGLLERSLSAAARAGVTSQRVERVLDTVGLADTVADAVPTDAIRAATEQVDFATSTAYMRSRIELGIRLNVAGREPDGVVAAGQYETVRSELIDLLRDVTTPDGEPVFDDVLPREAVFEGPQLEGAPDIVLVPASFDQFISGSLLGEQFGSPREAYNHKRAGVVIATGADVEPEAMTDAHDPHLFDVAPTVLATFGVPPSDRMDGTALPFAESLDTQPYPEFEARDVQPRESETVEQHLANLGYLEDV